MELWARGQLEDRHRYRKQLILPVTAFNCTVKPSVRHRPLSSACTNV